MKLIAAAFIAALTSTSALAADVVFEEPPAPVVAEIPIFTWTGGYIGVQGGYLWSDVNFDDDVEGELFSDSFNGGLLGGYIGYNWQTGPWVFGAEGDLNAVWNDETFTVGAFDVDVGSDYLASLRGRVGYAIDRTLIFATAGVAFTQASAEADIGNATVSVDQDFTGWTIGAGAEYAFTNNWVGRVEYRYYDFGDQSFSDITNFGDAKLTNNTVTLGIAYKW